MKIMKVLKAREEEREEEKETADCADFRGSLEKMDPCLRRDDKVSLREALEFNRSLALLGMTAGGDGHLGDN